MRDGRSPGVGQPAHELVKGERYCPAVHGAVAAKVEPAERDVAAGTELAVLLDLDHRGPGLAPAGQLADVPGQLLTLGHGVSAKPVGQFRKLARHLAGQFLRRVGRGHPVLQRLQSLDHGRERPWLPDLAMAAQGVGEPFRRAAVILCGHGRNSLAPSASVWVCALYCDGRIADVCLPQRVYSAALGPRPATYLRIMLGRAPS